MPHSIFLAKIIGPVLVVVALAFLLNRQSYAKVVEGLLSNAAFMYIGAYMGLLLGLLIVNTHNVWDGSWVVIITVIGWIAMIKGVWLIMFPDHVRKFADAYQKKPKLLKFQLSLTFLFGVFMMYKGYF